MRSSKRCFALLHYACAAFEPPFLSLSLSCSLGAMPMCRLFCLRIEVILIQGCVPLCDFILFSFVPLCISFVLHEAMRHEHQTHGESGPFDEISVVPPFKVPLIRSAFSFPFNCDQYSIYSAWWKHSLLRLDSCTGSVCLCVFSTFCLSLESLVWGCFVHMHL